MTQSLWLDEPYTPRPGLTGHRHAPMVILGGGITGISTAYWLSREGVPSVVLERHAVGSGATGRNAGFLLDGTVPDFPELASRYGRRTARALWDFTLENRRRLVETCAHEQIACDLVPCGSVVAAASGPEMAVLGRAAVALQAEGYLVQILDRDGLRGLLPSVGMLAGGVFFPGDMGLNPVRFVRGLAVAAERRGASIFEHTPVGQIERAGAAWRALTPRASLQADHLVMALNAYTSLVDSRWNDTIVPIRGQVLASEPVGRTLFRHLFYANRGFEYWRQLPDGRVILGGLRHLATDEEVGHEDRLHPVIQTRLDAYLRDLGVPPDVTVTHRWSGIMGFVPDRLPLIGPSPASERLYVAGGYSGHGLAFAFLAGRMIAQLITSGASEYPRVLWPDRLPPGPRGPVG